MSAALGRLRRFFNDPLLVRTGGFLELTPLAATLSGPVDSLVASLESLLVARPAFIPSIDSRDFTIVTSDYATLVLLRPLLRYITQAAPEVRITVVPVTAASAALLLQGRVDLIAIPDELPMAKQLEELPHRSLFTDQWVGTMCAANDFTGDIIDREAVESLPYVQYHTVSDEISHVDLQLLERKIQPHVALTTRSLALVPSILPGTQMFSFIPQRLIDLSPLRNELRVLPTTLDFRPLSETVYWHPVHDTDPAHIWLRKQLAIVAASV